MSLVILILLPPGKVLMKYTKTNSADKLLFNLEICVKPEKSEKAKKITTEFLKQKEYGKISGYQMETAV